MGKCGKRFSAGILAAVLAASGLLGCGGKKEEQKDQAMGRYMEEELPLPEGMYYIEDMEMMEDDSLWVAGFVHKKGLLVYSTKDRGETWEVEQNLGEALPKIGERDTQVHSLVLGKNGEAAVNIADYADYENNRHVDASLWYVDAQGNEKALLEGIDSRNGDYLGRVFFDKKGNVVADVTLKGYLQISPDTGEQLHEYQKEGDRRRGLVCGNILMASIKGSAGMEVEFFDLEAGKPLEKDAVLEKRLLGASGWTDGMPTRAVEDEETGTMFFCDSQGIYSYVWDGSVIEEVVDGESSALGEADVLTKDFEKGRENDFYVARIKGDGIASEIKASLLRYYYNPDIPTVPDEDLRIYALDDYPELSQAVIFYQKKYPEVRVTVETPLDELAGNRSSSEGYLDARRADSLKILNTEILAGKGPDVLILDDMPADTYVEKGILQDISGIVEENGEILDNIVETYKKENGKIYAVPARVQIPAVFGESSLVKEDMTLEDLAEAVLKAGENLEEGRSAYPYFSAVEMNEIFLRASADGWKKEDGTLDEEKVRRYMELTQRIYQEGKGDTENNRGTYGGGPLEKGIGLSLVPVYFSEKSKLTFGEICSPAVLEQMESMVRADKGRLSWGSLEPGAYTPRMTLGISTKAGNKERAEEFVSFMLGEEAQEIQQGNGFSVHGRVLERDSYWGITEEKESGIPKNILSTDLSDKELEFYPVTQEQKNRVLEILQSLDSPYMLDVQVRALLNTEMKSCLTGKQSLEEAEANLRDKMKIYLSE